jgi:hypothetical protein
MESEFVLPIEYGGEVMELPARLVRAGYIVKLEVEIENTIITFEPDEERNWRAVMGYEDLINSKKVKVELLEAVAKFLETLTQ